MEHFDASLSTYFKALLGPRGKVVFGFASFPLPTLHPLPGYSHLQILCDDILENISISYGKTNALSWVTGGLEKSSDGY